MWACRVFAQTITIKLISNGVWQGCYGGDCGYSMWNFAGQVTNQGLVLRVQPLCFVWLMPSDVMWISMSHWKGFHKELKMTIRYLDQPLSHFLETYTNADDKHCCWFMDSTSESSMAPNVSQPTLMEGPQQAHNLLVPPILTACSFRFIIIKWSVNSTVFLLWHPIWKFLVVTTLFHIRLLQG